MTLTESPAVEHALTPALLEALAFEAPYVVERLVNDRIVDSAQGGEELFTEVKRYLVMSEVNSDVVVGMCSARVDEAWHAFILYTAEYTNFCQRFFGRYVGHAPKNAPKSASAGAGQCVNHPVELSFSQFCEKYEELFDELLPDVWLDPRGIAVTQRVFNDSAGLMTVGRHDSVAELVDEHGEVLLSADVIVYEAMEFIARTGAFYVRELPGGLTDAERVRLVETLVVARALRLAP